jgi:hypothetical protein
MSEADVKFSLPVRLRKVSVLLITPIGYLREDLAMDEISVARQSNAP